MAMVFLSNILAAELHCAAALRSAIAVALAVVSYLDEIRFHHGLISLVLIVSL